MKSSKSDPEPIAFDKPTLEIQQLREQVEKLRVEIVTLRESSEWNQRVGRYLPLATAFVAVAGMSLGVWQFNVGRRDAVMREVARPFWENQLEIYVQAATAAAEVAVETDPTKSKEAQVKFWTLYWGPMGCVEDVTLASASKEKGFEVEAAMVDFGKALQPQNQTPSTPEDKRGSTPINFRSIDSELSGKLQPLALQIAHAIRQQLKPSFDLKIDAPSDAEKRKDLPPSTTSPPTTSAPQD